MLTKLDFKQVDVFTALPFKGNPLAVIFDADALTDAQLQSIATWTNLSETIFFFKPSSDKADYRVRIFTQVREITFAGHPTIGACHAFKEKYQSAKRALVQECPVGLVDLEVNDEDEIFFTLPQRIEMEFTASALADLFDALGVTEEDTVAIPKLFNVGPKWLVFQLHSNKSVLSLNPNLTKLKAVSQKYGIAGCCCFGEISDKKYETRTFAPASGIDEDPVCGSGAAAVGSYINTVHGFNGVISLSQGQKVSRDGKITVILEGNTVKVGGNAVTVVEGTIRTQ